jgi:hypothetical protein
MERPSQPSLTHQPYGAGSSPPELAGRAQILETASIALDRMGKGLSAKSLMLVGLRGVGKTVLLNRMHLDAEAKGIPAVMLEAPERRSLPALLIPNLRVALLKLDRMAAAGDRASQRRACQRRAWGSAASAVWDARQRLTVGLHA